MPRHRRRCLATAPAREIAANPGGTTVTTAKVSTSATTGAAASTSAVIQHTYQGSTGSVIVTLGNPVPVFSATFSSSDFSTMLKGLVRVRAPVYPNIGNVVLDTQTGADGTGCDWWYIICLRNRRSWRL